MRIHYLQHVPFEPLGSIAPWARQRGYEVAGTDVHAGTPLPGQQAFDALIVMGGPMSVNDEDRLPWLRVEKRFIEQTLKEDKPILGICLGSQLIANVAGAAVAPHGRREIGWLPVRHTPGAPNSFFPDQALMFHWHGERFELPAGAVHLASSEACDNQAFMMGEKVLALQFHMEFTREIVAGLAERSRDELQEGGRYVQDTDTMLGDQARFEALRGVCFSCLDAFLGVSDNA